MNYCCSQDVTVPRERSNFTTLAMILPYPSRSKACSILIWVPLELKQTLSADEGHREPDSRQDIAILYVVTLSNSGSPETLEIVAPIGCRRSRPAACRSHTLAGVEPIQGYLHAFTHCQDQPRQTPVTFPRHLHQLGIFRWDVTSNSSSRRPQIEWLSQLCKTAADAFEYLISAPS